MKAYSGVHGEREFQRLLSLRMEIEDEVVRNKRRGVAKDG